MMYNKDKLDQIRIKDLEVFSHHGVFPEENVLGQKFVMDIILYLKTREAGVNDTLVDSVHYGEVCKLVERLMVSENNQLLERVAERITRQIFHEYPLVEAIDFEIKKPWAPVLSHLDYVSVKIKRERHIAYIGLGSNMGDKKKYLEDAMDAIDGIEDTKIMEKASLIETEPYGYTQQDTFLNTVVCIQTLLTPLELLKELQRIELENGRTREIHWGPRTLDLDILLYDDAILTEKELVIPHPEIEKRLFVLESLCEIAPFKVHPLLQKRFITLKEEIKDK